MSGIKQLRIAKGWTQSELGKRAGLGQHRISLIERGLKPKSDEFERLKKVLTERKSNGQK